MMRHRIPLPSTRRSHVSAWGSADCRCIRCSSVVCALGVGTAAARLFAPALGSPIAYPRPAQLPSHIPNFLLSPKKMAKKPIQKKSKKAAKKAGGRRKKGKRSYRSYSGAQKPRVRECSDQSICKCTGACVFVLWLGAAPSWAPLYISKVVKGLKGKFKMSKKAMAIVNSFAADLFDRGPTPRLRLGCVLRLLCWRFCTALFGSTRCVSPPQDRRRGRPPGQAHRRQDAVLRGHAGGLPPPGELRAPAAAPLFARQCSHRATP